MPVFLLHTFTRIQVRWSKCPLKRVRILIANFVLPWSILHTCELYWHFIHILVIDETVVLTGLEPGQLYAIRIVANNSAGQSNGDPLLITTLDQGRDFISLEFAADYWAIFGAPPSDAGLSGNQSNIIIIIENHWLFITTLCFSPSRVYDSRADCTSWYSSGSCSDILNFHPSWLHCDRHRGNDSGNRKNCCLHSAQSAAHCISQQ